MNWDKIVVSVDLSTKDSRYLRQWRPRGERGRGRCSGGGHTGCVPRCMAFYEALVSVTAFFLCSQETASVNMAVRSSPRMGALARRQAPRTRLVQAHCQAPAEVRSVGRCMWEPIRLLCRQAHCANCSTSCMERDTHAGQCIGSSAAIEEGRAEGGGHK